MKIRSSLNYSPTKLKRGESDTVSLTIPNQSLTVRQIMTRHMAGLTPDVQHKVEFEEEPELMGFNRAELARMDIAELDQLKRENDVLLNSYKQKQLDIMSKKQKEAYNAKIKAEAEKIAALNAAKSEE